MNTTATTDAGRSTRRIRRVAALAAIVSLGVIGTASTTDALARGTTNMHARYRGDATQLFTSFGAGGHVTYR